MIGKCTSHIQIASADLIKSGNATGKETFLVWDVETETLAYKDMRTHTGRETVIALWIAVRFFRPEFITENSIEVQTARQWFERESVAYLFFPRDEVLFQCHGKLAIVG